MKKTAVALDLIHGKLLENFNDEFDLIVYNDTNYLNILNRSYDAEVLILSITPLKRDLIDMLTRLNEVYIIEHEDNDIDVSYLDFMKIKYNFINDN